MVRGGEVGTLCICAVLRPLLACSLASTALMQQPNVTQQASADRTAVELHEVTGAPGGGLVGPAEHLLTHPSVGLRKRTLDLMRGEREA